MTERPIIFDGESVRAILGSRKTQMRRVAQDMNPTYLEKHAPSKENDGHWGQFCPFGDVGDQLWVREGFARVPAHWLCQHPERPANDDIIYRVDGPAEGVSWTSAARMPRWNSRITLEITGVRVQRLQDTDENDARAEGCTFGMPGRAENPFPQSLTGIFAARWDLLNAKRGFPWASDPFVWAISFRRVKELP